MGSLLLRTLMTICELGSEWADASKIPVDEIVEVWREQSNRGRYESAMWRSAGLEEPNAQGDKGAEGNVSGEVAEADVDNTTAGGFFQWMGRDPASPASSAAESAAEVSSELNSGVLALEHYNNSPSV